MRLQANARHGIDQVAKIYSLRWRYPGNIANGMALGPFQQSLATALIGDLEGRAHVFLEPVHQLAEEARGLRFVDRLGVAGGRRGEVDRRRVAAQDLPEPVVRADQVEEHLVRYLVVLETRRLVGLDEVNVEVPRRRCRRSFVGCPEEQVAQACGLARTPLDLVLPRSGSR